MGVEPITPILQGSVATIGMEARLIRVEDLGNTGLTTERLCSFSRGGDGRIVAPGLIGINDGVDDGD